MRYFIIFSIAFLQFQLSLPRAHAQRVEIQDNPETIVVQPENRSENERGLRQRPPQTGKKAAQEYFIKEKSVQSGHTSMNSDDHYLMIGVGAFFKSENYNWGNPDASNPGRLNLDVTYRFGEWVNSMDFLIRLDYAIFDLDAEKKPKKLSFLPMITFPDAGSKFPLYFGVGAGLGVFFSQLRDESAISFDYQLILGVRFFNVVNSMGLYAETGMKNHILLLSGGQFNGFYANIGTVHTF